MSKFFVFFCLAALPFMEGRNHGLTTMAAVLHEFHVSKVQVDYNVAEKAVQISMHIFIDDLEEALRKQGVNALYFCTKKENEKADMHLEAYLHQCFQLEIDGKAVTYEYIGKEPSEDLAAIWCYLEITNIADLQELSISNSVLMEVFDDQKNIIQITKSGKNQGYFLFSKGNSSDRVRF